MERLPYQPSFLAVRDPEVNRALYEMYQAIAIAVNQISDSGEQVRRTGIQAMAYYPRAGAQGRPGALDAHGAPPVTDQSASEGPDFAEDGTVASKITVSFTPPSPLGNWGCCEIWKATLDGPGGSLTENPVLVAELITSPASWQWRPNGEWVRLYFVSVSTGGRRAVVLTSPIAEVLLDGQTSPPVPVSGFGGVADGQQVRLSWRENLEADMDHYDIARRDSAGPPGETDIISCVIAAGNSTV